MDFQSLLRFGNLAVGMLNTPQFKNMAKFAVPFIQPPARTSDADASESIPKTQGPSHWPSSYPGIPGQMHFGGMPHAMHPFSGGPHGSTSTKGIAGNRPRLGGFQALQGLMGHGQPHAAQTLTNPLSGLPFKHLFKYATPQNVQKVMEWRGVMKEFSGMFGGGSSVLPSVANAATASNAKKPVQLKLTEGNAQSSKPAPKHAVHQGMKQTRSRAKKVTPSKQKRTGR